MSFWDIDDKSGYSLFNRTNVEQLITDSKTEIMNILPYPYKSNIRKIYAVLAEL